MAVRLARPNGIGSGQPTEKKKEKKLVKENSERAVELIELCVCGRQRSKRAEVFVGGDKQSTN